MIEFGEVIHAKYRVKGEPDDNDRSKCGGDLACTKRLDQEEAYQYASSSSYNCRLADTRYNDFEALHSPKDRLGWRQDSVRHDHRHGEDTDDPEHCFGKYAVLQSATQMTTTAFEIKRDKPFHLYQRRFPWVTIRDVGLEPN